jgi:ABC-type oligopeptide transport system substrate-binding subunit
LKKLGIDVNLRSVDINQYKNRLNNFDFDMFNYYS